jgi:hypothetical protein
LLLRLLLDLLRLLRLLGVVLLLLGLLCVLLLRRLAVILLSGLSRLRVALRLRLPVILLLLGLPVVLLSILFFFAAIATRTALLPACRQLPKQTHIVMIPKPIPVATDPLCHAETMSSQV